MYISQIDEMKQNVFLTRLVNIHCFVRCCCRRPGLCLLQALLHVPIHNSRSPFSSSSRPGMDAMVFWRLAVSIIKNGVRAAPSAVRGYKSRESACSCPHASSDSLLSPSYVLVIPLDRVISTPGTA